MNEFRINILNKFKKIQKRRDFVVSIIIKLAYEMQIYIDFLTLVKFSHDRDLKFIKKELQNNK